MRREAAGDSWKRHHVNYCNLPSQRIDVIKHRSSESRLDNVQNIKARYQVVALCWPRLKFPDRRVVSRYDGKKSHWPNLFNKAAFTTAIVQPTLHADLGG